MAVVASAPAWGPAAVSAIGSIAGGILGKPDSPEPQGPDQDQINRARRLFSNYMDYAQTGLFDIAKMSKSNRKKAANKLFQLQNVGEPMRQAALRGGYNNAQARLGQTNEAMMAAILGQQMPTSFMDKRQIPMNLDPLKRQTIPDLQGISEIGLPEGSARILGRGQQAPTLEELQMLNMGI